MQVPFDELGAAAVRVQLDRVEHRRPDAEDRPQAPENILRGELIVRRTTGPLPVAT